MDNFESRISGLSRLGEENERKRNNFKNDIGRESIVSVRKRFLAYG